LREFVRVNGRVEPDDDGPESQKRIGTDMGSVEVALVSISLCHPLGVTVTAFRNLMEVRIILMPPRTVLEINESRYNNNT
jgi:hypothetical protein